MESAIHGSVTQNKAALRTGGAKGSGVAGVEICAREGAVAVAVDRELLAGQSPFLGEGSFAGARSVLRSGEMEDDASQDRSRQFDARPMRLRQFCLSAFPRRLDASRASTLFINRRDSHGDRDLR